MGAIQNAINEASRTVGIAASLNPKLQEKIELEKLKQQWQAEEDKLKEMKSLLRSEFTGDFKKDAEEFYAAQHYLNIPEKQIEQAKLGAELGVISPSIASKRIRQGYIHKDISSGVVNRKYSIKPLTPEQILQLKQMQANQKAQAVKKVNNEQRERFKKSIILNQYGLNYSSPIEEPEAIIREEGR